MGSNWRATSNIVAGLVTWAFMAGYWTLLWRGSVQWNRWRITTTLLSAVLLTIAGIFLGFLAEELVYRSEGMFGAFCGSMFVPVSWLIATVFLWRENTDERRSRVASASTRAITCPTCGYNLTGLTSTRCPECGSQSTLDELFAAQIDSRSNDVES